MYVRKCTDTRTHTHPVQMSTDFGYSTVKVIKKIFVNDTSRPLTLAVISVGND